jgi:hypothetical protein
MGGGGGGISVSSIAAAHQHVEECESGKGMRTIHNTHLFVIIRGMDLGGHPVHWPVKHYRVCGGEGCKSDRCH